MQLGEVNVAFKEPVHKIVDRIKNEPFFRWPNKMGGNPSQRNQNLYCTYHKDKRTYNRAMPSVERPSGVASESGTFEGVCCGIQESWCQARGSIKREPSPATLRGDQGHPCRAEGYEYSQNESLGRDIHGGLFRESTTCKENEKSIGAHCLR